MAFTNPSITFGSTGLQGESSNNPTALDTSKTGAPIVYVTQQDGNVYRYEIERQDDNNGDGTDEFVVTGTTQMNVIPQTIQNYNDDGSLNTTQQRQVTGIVVTKDDDGNDVLYVSSSDWRIAVGNDSGLDTNSGQIHKIVVDPDGNILSNVAILRGLPRSEENHSTNGLDISIDPVTGDEILWIAQGGNTNKGAPGNNFAGTVDYALSGTILKVNLTELESFDIRTDANGDLYVMDLPTLDDPTRDNVDLVNDLGLDPAEIPDNYTIDEGPAGQEGNPDFAGGHNGLNMAKITEKVLVSVGGELTFVDNPLAVHSPGFRNQYDVLVTEDNEVFTWDNGPNGGWGGQPLSQEDGQVVDDWTSEFATNQFNESGSDGFGDQLHYLGETTDAFGPYGGDANPIRAAHEAIQAAFNPDGTYTGATSDDPVIANGVELFANEAEARAYLTSLLIIYEEQGDGNWVDVTGATGLPADFFDVVNGYLWEHPGSSLSDPTSYYDGTSVMDNTAYSPESQLLNDNNDGSLKTVNASTNGLAEYTATFFGGALDGAIIAASFDGNLYFEKPIDTNGDGRTDAVESLGTIGGFGSQPLGVTALGDDGFSSDVLIDNDGDGIDDFAGLIFAATYGANNITVFQPGGTPADPSTDLDLDGVNNTLDSHVGDPDNGLGVRVGADGTALWHFELNDPETTPPGAIPDGNSIAGDIGINAVWRNETDVQVAPPGEFALYDAGVWNLGGASTVVSIDVANSGSAEGIDNDQGDVLGIGFAVQNDVGAISIVSEGKNIFAYSLNETKTWDGGEKYGLVVGPGNQTTFVQAAVVVRDVGGTPTFGVELLVEENDVNSSVFVEIPGIEAPIVGLSDPNMQVAIDLDLTPGAATAVARARYVTDGSYTDWVETAAIAVPSDVISAVRGTYQNGAQTTGAFVGLLATTEDGDDSFGADWDFVEITGTPLSYTEGEILYRWNAGDTNVAAIDGGPDWVQTGAVITGSSAPSTQNGSDNGLDASAPSASTPLGLYTNEYYGNDAGSPFGLEFGNGALADGYYAVRLFMANGYDGTSAIGSRVFDVSIEDGLFLDDIDLVAEFGHKVGGMFEWIGYVDDGTIDIDFGHVVENPLINAVEIVSLDTTPGGPAISVVPEAVAEGDAGVTEVFVTVQSSEVVPSGETVFFDLEIRGANNGATPEVDFTVPGATFNAGTGVYTLAGSIAGNSADFTFEIEVIGDTDAEFNENIEVALVSVSGADAYIGTPVTPITILNDDGPVDGIILYRVNAGGPEVAATDGGPNWSADTDSENSPFLVNPGSNNDYPDTGVATGPIDLSEVSDYGAPEAVYGIERWDAAGDPAGEMAYAFDVPVGTQVEIRLLLAENYQEIFDEDGSGDATGDRVFSVSVDGTVPAAFQDIDQYALAGTFNKAAIVTHTVVSDGTINLEFVHGVENPAIKGIEIVAVGGTPISLVSIGDPVSATVEEAGDTGFTTLVFPVTFDTDPSTYVELEYSVDINGAVTTGLTQSIAIGGGEITVNVPNDAIDNGDDAVTVTLTGVNSGPAVIDGTTASATVTEDDIAPIVVAVNVGGPALSQGGIDFEGDNYFDNGNQFTDGTGGSPDQPVFDGTVFETERWGGGGGGEPLSFSIPVDPGSYTVELYFAEIYLEPDTLNGRVFNVYIEGQLVIENLDILAETGGDINQPVVIQLPDEFSPDQFDELDKLDITLEASVDNAKLSAIVVREAPQPTGGAATLAVTVDSDDVQISNYGGDSFVLANTGTKKIVQVDIDVTNALYTDSVFDPYGIAGDTIGKELEINTDSGTGVNAPSSASYIGAGGIDGFEGLRLTFDTGTNGGFEPGDTVGFSVDMDPNSIAGADKGTLDSGASPAWDIGGISGAELIGSTFTITFEDGTTATGQLMGASNQGGSKGLASQDSPELGVTLQVNGLDAGGVGTYADGGPSVTVQGEAGQTARIVLTKGIIQPFENNFPDGAYADQLDAQLAALASSDFPANNATEFQTVDILLDGTVQDISGLFNFTEVPGYDLPWNEAQLPLGFVAAVIDTANDDLPLGPVTAPVYLTYAENAAPVIDAIAPIVITEGEDAAFSISATDANDDAITLSVEVTDDSDGSTVDPGLYTFTDNGDGTGSFSWTTGEPDDGTYSIEVTATDGVSSSTQVVPLTVNEDVPPQPGDVLYRVNTGGVEQALSDGGPAWSADTAANNSPYLVNQGSNNVYEPGNTVDISGLSEYGITAAVMQVERYDLPDAADPNGAMAYAFDVPAGTLVELRIYVAELYTGLSDTDGSGDLTGDRVFDVSVDGVVPPELAGIDPYALGGDFNVGSVVTYTFVSDGTVDVSFLHGVENPAVKAIELVVAGEPDTTPPLPNLTAPDVTTPDSSYQFEVTFDDENGIDVSTLDDFDVTVTRGAISFVATAALVGVDVNADGTPRTATYEITPPGGAWDPDDNGSYVVTLNDGEVADLLGNVTPGQTLGSFIVDVVPTDQVEGGSLLVQVTPGTGLDSSTFAGSSFILTNESAPGVQIASVTFNLQGAILPEIVFDPTGAGGDATASPFTPNSGGGVTGLVVPGDPSSDPFSDPHNGGFDTLTIEFTDFDPGEQFTFTTDIDPNNIQGVEGAGNAGSVSGYELIGSTVTVTFTDGLSTEVSLASLFDESVITGGPGSLGGSAARVTTEDAVTPPTLSIVGSAGDAVPTLYGDQVELTSSDFTVLVTGEPNGTVELLQADTRLYIASGDAPFDVTQAELPYHSNEAMSGKVLTTVTLDGSGQAEVPLSLLKTLTGNGTPDGGVNSIIAVSVNGAGDISVASPPLMVRLETELVYDAPGVMEFNGTSGGVLEIPHSDIYEIPAGTIAFSFIAADTNGAQGLFVKDASYFVGGGNHFALYLDGNTLVARFQDGSTSAIMNFPGIQAGQEYEIAVTFGPDGSQLWVDGNLVGNSPLVMDWTQNVEYIQWGGRGWGSASGQPGFDAPFEGVIADKQIYAGVLDSAKIAALAGSSSASNTDPVANDDAVTTDEDQSVNIDVLANDTDADGDTVTVAGIQSQPTNGTAVVEADGTVTYTPDPDFNGSDSFTVSIIDGLGGVDTSTVSVTVNPVNDAPTANDDTTNAIVDTPVEIDVLANDTDPDGDTLTILSVEDGTSGTTAIVDGKVVYTPDAGFIGTDTFTYITEDGAGESAQGTVEVIVTAEPNAEPVAVDDSITVAEDGSVTFQPGDNDTDANGDTVIAFGIASGASNGVAVVNGDGTVTYTPNANFTGSDSFEVTVTDGQGGFDTSTVTVDVTPENDPPVANDDGVSTTSGQPVLIDIFGNDTDIDGDLLNLVDLTDPALGQVVVNANGTLTYTPNPGATGQDTFEYTISDGEFTDTATVTVNIQSFPAPIYEALGDMSFNGANSGVQQLPHNAIYEIEQGTIAFSFEAADTNGAQGLFVKDASGYAGGGNHFALFLNGSNLVARFQNGSSESVLTIPGISAGQEYDVAVTFGPGGGSVFLNGTEVAFTPMVMDWTQNVEWIQWGGRGWGSASGQAGFDAPFEGTISDKRIFDVELTEDQIEQLFTDGPVNADPIAVDDTLTVAEDGSGSLFPLDNDSDPEGDAIFVDAVVSGPSNGVATIGAGGEVFYTPNADFFGTDSFTLRIEDSFGGSDESVVTVTVTPSPDDPIATDDDAATQTDQAVVIDVLDNDDDPDGDTLTVSSVGTATNGSVVLNADDTVTYTPDAGFTGVDEFIYTVDDGNGGSDTATVSVNVTDAPVLPDPIFAQGGVSNYNGTNGDVDQYAHQSSFLIPEGTIAFSFIADNPGATAGLVVKDASGYAGGGNHFASYLQNGDLKLRVQDGGSEFIMSFDDIVAGQEYEVAVTFGAGGVVAYVDGAVIGSNSGFDMDWTANQEYLQVGGLGWGSATGAPGFTNPFDGQIADVEIYDEALNSDQIDLLADMSSFDVFSI
ncbi:Ig-like domain-containing protein [Psychromarinibacter sp. S121]|uniref:Ig-like domain-containing protein n=1 Tax=Psychromarinibacter sp. S121 TaxID=3415127 RepID=UPI003C79D3B1